MEALTDQYGQARRRRGRLRPATRFHIDEGRLVEGPCLLKLLRFGSPRTRRTVSQLEASAGCVAPAKTTTGCTPCRLVYLESLTCVCTIMYIRRCSASKGRTQELDESPQAWHQ